MSAKNGVWHDARIDLPPDSQRVLCIKLPKNGHMDYCFGAYYPDKTYGTGWVTTGSCDNVIYWMPLPKMPD